MSADTVIEIEDVWKLFSRMEGKAARIKRDSDVPEDNAFWALREISFSVPRGEVMGLIGPNGAGKSTLLKIISRVSTPTRGRVRLRGSVVSLLEVGTGFHDDLTGRENIALNATILGMSEADLKRRFDEIVAFSGVEGFIDSPVKHLSSGMRMRLGFSIAVHSEPDILIVDEVLAVGDADFQEKCRQKVAEIVRAAGRTVMIVSHAMTSVDKLCSRVALLEQGRLVRIGETQEVIDHYLDAVAERASVSQTPQIEAQAPEPPDEETLRLEAADREARWREKAERRRVREEYRQAKEEGRRLQREKFRAEKERLREEAARAARARNIHPISLPDFSWDLRPRIDRRGNGEVRLEKLALCGADGVPINRAAAGGPLTLKLRYSAKIEEPGLHNAAFNFVIANGHDVPVFWLPSSAAQGLELPLRPSGELACRLPTLPLLPGAYKINIWAQLNGEVSDRIDHAADLIVEDAGFFPTGRVQRSRYGDVLVKQAWSFESADEERQPPALALPQSGT